MKEHLMQLKRFCIFSGEGGDVTFKNLKGVNRLFFFFFFFCTNYLNECLKIFKGRLLCDPVEINLNVHGTFLSNF